MAAYIRRNPLGMQLTSAYIRVPGRRSRSNSSSSPACVASRRRDPSFENLMDGYKHLFRVLSVQDLILSDPRAPSPESASISLDFLDRLSQKLHLHKGPSHFLRSFPLIFTLFPHPSKRLPFCALTQAAVDLARQEEAAKLASLPLLLDRLVRVLSMSLTKSVPLRAINKVYRELGLPHDYEHSVISRHPALFRLQGGDPGNTPMLKLVQDHTRPALVASVENWRLVEYCNGDLNVDGTHFRYCFKHTYPPGLKTKTVDFKKRVNDWQRLAYVGPYDEVPIKGYTKASMRQKEKRAVGIVHEFLSVTVDKMVEVERISHFRKWFGIELNMRDLFLDHPGMFYLSTKGNTHTVFLREAYQRGRLMDPNPVHEVRMKLLHLVLLGCHGMVETDAKSRSTEFEEVESIANESKLESEQSDKDGF